MSCITSGERTTLVHDGCSGCTVSVAVIGLCLGCTVGVGFIGFISS